MERAQHYRAIVRDPLVPPGSDSLARALSEIRNDLAGYPLFEALGTEWIMALCGTIDGMVREYEWRLDYQRQGEAALPSYTDYLAAGRYSIGGPPHVWAAIATCDDLSSARCVDHLRRME